MYIVVVETEEVGHVSWYVTRMGQKLAFLQILV